jgi:hypothetical protein
MRPLKSLTFEALRDLLARTFKKIPDERAPERVKWQLHSVLMSAFAMLFFQHPSLLNYQRRMKDKRGLSNLERVFQINDLPSDTQMREILDGVPPEELRQVLPEIFQRMQRTGWTVRFVTRVEEKSYYTVALDGSEYFHSTQIHCVGCLQRKSADGVVHYSHVVVAATIVKAGTHDILPLDAEEIRNEDGQKKQDCEINAGKRLVKRLRQEHPQLSICITGDDLYAHEPFVELLRDLRMAFVLIAKPQSHQELFEWVEELERMGETEHGEWSDGPAAKRRYFKYRIARQVPLKEAGKIMVNFVELWEYNKAGKQVYHNSWVTDFEVTAENVATITGIGRSRWKIENEHFNVHKNQGYELEHNYGHGEKTLSMVFYMLNLLAFLWHKILDYGDSLYRRCREKDSLKGLWETLRVTFCLIEVESWRALLEYVLNEELAPP